MVDAIKADTLSVVAFQVGMYGWMLLSAVVLFEHMPHAASAVFWLLMQIGMVCGFATSYPANGWLIKRGM